MEEPVDAAHLWEEAGRRMPLLLRVQDCFTRAGRIQRYFANTTDIHTNTAVGVCVRPPTS